MTRVYLHALGIINALGSGDGIREGLSCGTRSGVVLRTDFIPGRSVHVAEVREPLPDISPRYAHYDSRCNQLLEAAVAQIEHAILMQVDRYGPARVGIVMGTSTSGIHEGEQARSVYHHTGKLPDGFHYLQQEISSPSEYLRRKLGLHGPAWTVATACTSSAKAFASARRLLRLNVCDAVIVGGSDSLSRLTVNGFMALEALTKGICNPFSRNRDGIMLGEGAVVLIMSRDPGPVCLIGVGESSDAHHISGPDPEGRGAEIAMRAALADAGLSAPDVDYLNLHGTGTLQNDYMESHAVYRVFGGNLPCSSTKPLVGHLLGTAGAMEVAFCWLMLTDPAATTRLPPHVWDGESDPALAPLDLTGTSAIGGSRCHVMASNSFAFGGSNATVILAA